MVMLLRAIILGAGCLFVQCAYAQPLSANQFTSHTKWSESAPSESQCKSPTVRHKGFYFSFVYGGNAFRISDGKGESYEKFVGLAGSLSMGYQFSPYFAFEGGALYYDNIATGTPGIFAGIKGIAPLTERFAFLGFLGGQILYLPSIFQGSNITEPYAGIGAAYALTDQIELTAEFSGISISAKKYKITGTLVPEGSAQYGLLGMGLTYHF